MKGLSGLSRCFPDLIPGQAYGRVHLLINDSCFMVFSGSRFLSFKSNIICAEEPEAFHGIFQAFPRAFSRLDLQRFSLTIFIRLLIGIFASRDPIGAGNSGIPARTGLPIILPWRYFWRPSLHGPDEDHEKTM